MTTARQPHELDETDQLIVAALAAGETRAEAATRAGISPSTVNRRLARPAVRAAVSDARRAAFAVPLSNAMRLLPLGLARLETVLRDDTAPLSAVIRAADTVASIAVRLSAPAAELEGHHAIDAGRAVQEQQETDGRAEKAARRARAVEVPSWLPGRMGAAADLIAGHVHDFLDVFADASAAERAEERSRLTDTVRSMLTTIITPPQPAGPTPATPDPSA